MVEARRDHDRDPVADAAAGDLSHLADASAQFFAQQAAAMAAMTAYGMTIAAQMTGMMLGSLRGPVPVEWDEERAARPSPAEQSDKVVELRPRPAKTSETRPAVTAGAAVRPVRKAANHAGSKAAPARAAAPKPTRRPAATARPAARDGDDLKKISGVGPRLERELNDRGITRYADIAGLSKAAVKKLDSELGLEGRIARDDWAGQARALSEGKA